MRISSDKTDYRENTALPDRLPVPQRRLWLLLGLVGLGSEVTKKVRFVLSSGEDVHCVRVDGLNFRIDTGEISVLPRSGSQEYLVSFKFLEVGSK